MRSCPCNTNSPLNLSLSGIQSRSLSEVFPGLVVAGATLRKGPALLRQEIERPCLEDAFLSIRPKHALPDLSQGCVKVDISALYSQGF